MAEETRGWEAPRTRTLEACATRSAGILPAGSGGIPAASFGGSSNAPRAKIGKELDKTWLVKNRAEFIIAGTIPCLSNAPISDQIMRL